MYPCLVPVLTSNASVSPPPWITLHLEPYVDINQFLWCAIWLLKIFHKVSLSALSNAFHSR